jgi:hypothetical protein
MKIIAFIWVMGFSILSHAAPAGLVQKVEGSVTLQSKEKNTVLTTGSGVNFGDQLKGEEGSFARLIISQQTIILRGPFSIEISESGVKKDVSLVNLLFGKLRMILKSDSKAALPVVRTKTAVAGIRGTDLLVSYDPLLEETEVICFEHSIEFSALDGKSKVNISEGYWGGIGGRFGSTIRKPMKLKTDVIDHFKTILPF